MINAVCRSGLAAGITATKSTVGPGLRPVLLGIKLKAKEKRDDPPLTATPNTLDGLHMKHRSGLCVSRLVTGGTQVRYAHTDIPVPNFDAVRRDSVKNPTAKTSHGDERKVYDYTLAAVSGVVATYAAKNAVIGAVSLWTPSAATLAMAQIEIDLNTIPEGRSVTFKWRSKPLFVRHRTPEEIQREKAVDVSSLRHQEHDTERATVDPSWLVVIGVCTHLGCVPIADAGDFGGYYCPCHGSHYDGAGRIRKGPAPLNLEVPEYTINDNLLVVG